MQRKDLERLSREELVSRATAVGVVRPRALTIPELIDEILRVSEHGGERAGRGWFGRARDLLTSVIDRGLNLPDPRARRNEGRPAAAPPPLPTVTLAEIYAAQGHIERAISTLDEVLVRDPGNADAEKVRARLATQLEKRKPSTPPPVIEAKLVTMPPPPPGLSDAAEELSHAAELTAEVAPSAESGAAAADAAVEPPAAEAAASTGDNADVPPDDLEDEAPAFSEIDEIVALAVDPHTVYLYWEVQATTLGRAREEQPEGSLVVRAVTVVASVAGPRTEVRDVRVDALVGELFLEGLPAQANVRISVGYKSGEAFEPFAVGVELATPREAPSTLEAQSFRRFSEPRSPLARPHDPIEQAFRRSGDSQLRGDLEGDLLSRFPGGVWVDPALSVMHVSAQSGATEVVGADGGVVREVTQPAHPGSSDLVRRRVVWSSTPQARDFFASR